MPEKNDAPAATKPVGNPSPPAKNGSTVVVACRIPHGLELRAFRMIELQEPSPMGFKTVKQAEEIGTEDGGGRFVVRGPGRSMLTGLQPEQIESLHPGGYALTPGCPAELWVRWLEDNKDTPYIRREDIFSEPTMERARNHAIANSRDPNRETGLQPIDGDNPGKRVRGEGGLKIERGERPAA